MSNNALIVKNTIFLATRTIVSVLVSFYTTRVVLEQLGASDYGLFSVIYGMVGFTVFISSAMNESIQRFISMSLGSGDLPKLKDIVKNSIFSYLILSACFVFILLIFRDYIVYNFLNIPDNSLVVAKKIYVIAVLAIALAILQTPFNALVIAHENMSFYAYMSIFDVFSKLIISLLISTLNGEKLYIYSLLLLLSSFIVFMIYVGYCVKRFRYSFEGGILSLKIIKEITSFSFWNVFGNFAFVCRTQGINISINLFFATTVNAAYALSTSVLNALTSLTQALVMSIRPQIFKAYADANIPRYQVLINAGSKYTYSLLFLISSPLLICTPQVLSLWLVNPPEYTVVFVRFVLLVALIDSFSSSIITGIQATGAIKVYQIVVSFFVFISLPISYFLFSHGMPVYSVFIPLALFSLLNLNLRIYFLAKKSKFKASELYVKTIIPCIFASCISMLINILLKNLLQYDSIFKIMLCLLLHMSITFIVFVLITTSKNERCFFIEGVLRKLR